MMSGVEHRRLRVYVAGPMTVGDYYDNVHLGIKVGRKVFEDGMAPYVPHLDAFMYMGRGQEDTDMWADFLEWDIEWVAQSEAVLRIPGESKGADLEVAHAQRLGLPVFQLSSYDALVKFAGDQGLLATREDAGETDRSNASIGGTPVDVPRRLPDAGPDHPAITPVPEHPALRRH